jgi:hypothetical protein
VVTFFISLLTDIIKKLFVVKIEVVYVPGGLRHPPKLITGVRGEDVHS